MSAAADRLLARTDIAKAKAAAAALCAPLPTRPPRSGARRESAGRFQEKRAGS